MSGNSKRIKQVYDTYLDMLYSVDYYKNFNENVQKYAKHFDFVIALAAALSGGSGLGILGSPWMAVPCATITALSVVLSAAKQSYDWPGRSTFAVEMIERCGKMSTRLKWLVDDIQVAAAWSDDFEKKFSDIRAELTNFPVDKYKDLDLATQKTIQAQIVARENPAMWWKPT